MRPFSTSVRRLGFVIVAALIAGFAAAALVAALPPRVYEATAVAVVSGPAPTVEHEGPGIGARTAASYADVATTPTVLESVIERLGLHSNEAALASRVHARAVPDGPLIRVAVDDGSPTRATSIANAVADSLAAAISRLTPGPGAATAGPVRVVHRAEIPTDPVVPNVLVELTAGLLVAVLVGIAGLAALGGQRRGAEDRGA